MCKLWVAQAIMLYGAQDALAQIYVSPEQFMSSPKAFDILQSLDFIVSEIRGYLDTEDEPAYTRQMGRGIGGAEL